MENTKLSFIYRLTKDHKFYVHTHTHPNTEVVFYLKTKGSIKIDDKIYEFSDGSVAVINPETPHDERHNTPFDIFFMTFSFEHFQIPNGVYKPTNFTALEKIVHQIYRETRAPKSGFNLLISSKINELMVLLKRELSSNAFDENINECMLYLSENCHKDIDLQELSESHDIGYETFRHKFKKLYGMSPKNFIITKRLFKASDMIVKSELSCTDIAFECGFTDSSQFSKLFKRQFGVSPQKFKSNYKQKI